ncbi:hypothetical protein Salat_1133300 [Sesamum alatum]|uniref:Uncharacterized protein n=1 Tax=Sesamum alatum TaxID=300844 RepID=A0AAE1YE19_9LAMI|nr:hypothetical protein Salat_1133300 [Sesamum alatum]
MKPSRRISFSFFLFISPTSIHQQFAGAPLPLDSPPHREEFSPNPAPKLLTGGNSFSLHSVKPAPSTSVFALSGLSNITVDVVRIFPNYLPQIPHSQTRWPPTICRSKAYMGDRKEKIG